MKQPNLKQPFWKSYDYFFFDFDGVIADTVNVKADAFGELFRKYGEEIAKKVREHHLAHGGMTRFEKFKYYYKEFLNKEITEEEIERLSKEFSSLVVKKVIEAPFIPGAQEFLDMCLEFKKVCFVVSATPDEEIKHIVDAKGLSKYFKEVVGSPKSKEENLKALIDKYSIDINKALYFGDAQSDLEAAQKNGVEFVGINYFDGSIGYKDFDEFIIKVGRSFNPPVISFKNGIN